MKKLFSAVTSLVMAATFVSSAFTSSIVVSAAGSVPAVQPNVSMGGVKDITANKNISRSEYSKIVDNSDIVFDFTNPDSEDGYWRVDPEYGDVTVSPRLDTHGQLITGIQMFLDLEGDFTVEIDKKSPALQNVAVQPNKAMKGVTLTCAVGPDSTGIPATPDTPVFNFFFTPDANLKDGLYKISISENELEVLDADRTRTDISVIPGYIAIGDVASSNSSSTTTTNTTTTKATTTTITTKLTPTPESSSADNNTTTTTTTTVASSQADTTTTTTTAPPAPASGSASWVIPEVHAKKGETVKLDVVVSGDSDLAVAGAQFLLKASDSVGQPKATGGNAYSASSSLASNKNEIAFGHGQGAGSTAKNNEVIVSVEYTIPENITAGKYPVTWSDLFVSDTNGQDITDKIKAVDGAIIIDETYDGEIAWDIPEVVAKPGEKVTMDVLVIDDGNSAIPVAGAQFKINADKAEFVSVDGSEAYDSAVKNNKETNEFAFGQGQGKGTAAKNGAKVITLTYTAPTTPGVYPVTWSEEFISDTNGQDITDKITLLPGSITVAAQGDITWDIPEVTAKPGEKVTMDVLVIDEAGSALPVAGAQFKITADTAEFVSVDGSEAYDSAVKNNKETNEFAFGQGQGKGTAAKNGAKVITLTYTAPTTPGTYPVTWSEAFISDTNGLDITDQITLLPGSITV
ncbi:MAG: hypothetical protein K2H28_05100, partial [Ruminococcus sp.]|nr:hypothetical protein [Ruminococcus sp.]